MKKWVKYGEIYPNHTKVINTQESYLSSLSFFFNNFDAFLIMLDLCGGVIFFIVALSIHITLESEC